MNLPDAPASLGPLFEPLAINGLTLANRLVMGPAGVHSPTSDGRPSAETYAFFDRIARGGVGLIILGGTTSTTRDWDVIRRARPNTALRLDTDDCLPGLARLADTVHARGVPMFAQLNPSLGRMGLPGPDFISASPVPVFMSEQSLACVMPVPGGMRLATPREATVAEIQHIVRETVESGLRMRRAGFDGVEVGAHMSYFLASFLSPRTNLRTDEYGGSVENRARIVVDVVRGLRAGTEAEFPIGVRLAANEHTDGGQGPEPYAEIAALLASAGADFISLTEGGYESMELSFVGDGPLLRHGEADIFRRALSIPILLQGIHDAQSAADAIAAGRGDMIMLMRPLLADPELPLKLRAGRADEIVRCTRCNICLKRVLVKMPARCPENPSLGNQTRKPFAMRFRRALAAPVEGAVLRITSSQRVMALAAKLAPKAR